LGYFARLTLHGTTERNYLQAQMVRMCHGCSQRKLCGRNHLHMLWTSRVPCGRRGTLQHLQYMGGHLYAVAAQHF
jgi:hypothetical protein